MKKVLLSVLCVATLQVSAQTITPDFIANEAVKAYYEQGFDTPEEISTWEFNVTNSAFTWHAMEKLGNGPSFNSVMPYSRQSLGICWANHYAHELAVSPEIKILPNSSIELWSYFTPDYLTYGYFRVKVLTPTDTTMVFNQLEWYQSLMFEKPEWKKISIDLSRYQNQTVRIGLLYDGMGGESQLIDGFRVVQQDRSETAVVKINEGETVHFRDQSLGFPNKWQWEFEGGTPANSSESSPTVTYNKTGKYRVKLTVSNYDDSKTVERVGFVEVGKHGTVARIGLPDNGYYSPNINRFIAENTKLQYLDASPVAVNTRQWTIPGSDKPATTEQNPAVIYNEKGTFGVSLAITNDEGEDKEEIEKFVQVGGSQYIWNIAPEERPLISVFDYNFNLGYFGGGNSYGMEQFAEYYNQPSRRAYIDRVNVYFGIAEIVSSEQDITLSIAKSADGFPGDILATSLVKAKDLSSSASVPTEFRFDQPIEIDGSFFIIISNIPNGASGEQRDKVAVACVRRSPGERSTTFYYQSKRDEDGNIFPATWYKNNEEAASFAIAPLLNYDDPTGITDIKTDKEQIANHVYSIDGRKVEKGRLTKGIYIIDGQKRIIR